MRICVRGGGEDFRKWVTLPQEWELTEQLQDAELLVILPGAETLGRIQCGTLLLWEGEQLQNDAHAAQVIGCGFSPRSSLTLASLASTGAVLSVQRAILCPDGRCVPPQDIPLPQEWASLSAEEQVMLAGIALLTGTME